METENIKPKTGFFSAFSRGLKKTRESLTAGLGNLFLGKKFIDDSLLEEIETRLLIADVGVETTQAVIADLTAQVSRKELADASALMQALEKSLEKTLEPCHQPLQISTATKPYVILMVGINGSGSKI